MNQRISKAGAERLLNIIESLPLSEEEESARMQAILPMRPAKEARQALMARLKEVGEEIARADKAARKAKRSGSRFNPSELLERYGFGPAAAMPAFGLCKAPEKKSDGKQSK